MSNRDTIMILIMLALFVTSVIFWVQSTTRASELKQAEKMSVALTAHLKERQYTMLFTPCRNIEGGRYDVLNNCLDAIENADDLSKMFSRDDFRNPKDGQTGYLIIQNEKGGETFQSEKFTLYHNNRLLVTGCVTPGEIAPGFTCRLDMSEACEPGDNLEIKYDEKRAFLFTC